MRSVLGSTVGNKLEKEVDITRLFLPIDLPVKNGTIVKYHYSSIFLGKKKTQYFVVQDSKLINLKDYNGRDINIIEKDFQVM